MDMIKNSYTTHPGITGRIRGLFWGVLVMIMTIHSSWVSAAQAIATVSKNIVAVNEVFQLTISIDDNVNTSALDLTPLEKDFSYGRPSVSSGTTMINGVVSRSTEWTLALATKAAGEFTIPSFRIGATKTEPIVVSSLKSSNTSGQNQTKPDIKLDYDIEQKQLYIGESTSYTVRIRIGEQMSQAALIAPSGDGLEVKQIGEDRQAETVLNGRRYIIIIRDYQITARKAGAIKLQGAKFNGDVVKGNRGFGSSLRIPVEQQAEEIALEVKDKPAGYKGLWLPTPDLQLEQEWQPDSQEIRVGEPLTRTITLRIKNAEQSSMPNLMLQYPDTVRVYDEKPEYSSANGYTIMTLKQVILPRSEGELMLPALSINWWNTLTSKQETSRIEGLKLTAMPSDSANSFTLPALQAPTTTSTTIPAESASVETKIVADAGWWPWLTAIFAALWLFTALLLVKVWQRYRALQQAVSVTSSSKTTEISPLAGMKQAAKQKQPIQVQAFYQQWADENPEHSLSASLYKEVNTMMKAYFGKNPGRWDNADLLKLIRSISQAGTQPGSTSTKSPALAPLVPEK